MDKHNLQLVTNNVAIDPNKIVSVVRASHDETVQTIQGAASSLIKTGKKEYYIWVYLKDSIQTIQILCKDEFEYEEIFQKLVEATNEGK